VCIFSAISQLHLTNALGFPMDRTAPVNSALSWHHNNVCLWWLHLPSHAILPSPPRGIMHVLVQSVGTMYSPSPPHLPLPQRTSHPLVLHTHSYLGEWEVSPKWWNMCCFTTCLPLVLLSSTTGPRAHSRQNEYFGAQTTPVFAVWPDSVSF
jgi:hypothetical protein